MTESATTLDADDVRRRLGDTTHLRGEAGWEAARLPWNRFAQQRPAIVVGARSLSDVTAALDLARTAGLTVAVQSSGHGAGAALGELEGSLLIDMAAMRGVSIDAGRRRARVEAGATWGAVMDAAARHGLAGLSGSSPDVAVAGYTLGGGVGFLSRRYGLAANAVRAIDAVLADGTVVRADPTSHSDLFWAMRGGGGSFAVVTALEIELFPVASAYGGFLLWPVQRAAEVLHAWLDWTREVPDEATTSGRLLQFPPIPNIPASVRGQSFVGVDGAILGDLAAAKALLDPLRRLGPRLDTFSEVPASALTHIHMDPEEP